MNVALLVRSVGRRLRQDGPWVALRKAFTHVTRRSRQDDFDRKYGTNTGGIEPLWKLRIRSPNAEFGTRYEATNQQDFVNAIRFLKEDLTQFVFVDLGCGKGRTLLMAGELGFREVVGVEFAHELASIARQNLANRGLRDAVVHHLDAAEYKFPNASTIAYLYNPFSEQVARRVVENMRESEGKLYVVYKLPKCADVFDSSDFLRRIEAPPDTSNIQIWARHSNV